MILCGNSLDKVLFERAAAFVPSGALLGLRLHVGCVAAEAEHGTDWLWLADVVHNVGASVAAVVAGLVGGGVGGAGGGRGSGVGEVGDVLVTPGDRTKEP